MNAIAYADDLVLLASSRAGLQANLNALCETAGRLGLSLGFKSAVRWVWSGEASLRR